MSLGMSLLPMCFFLAMALGLACTAFVTAASEGGVVEGRGEDNLLERLSGNWSVSRLNGQRPQQTRFVVEVTVDALLLREESPGVLEGLIESWIRFLWAVGESGEQSSACSASALLADSRPRMASARVSSEGIHLLDCAGIDSFPLPKHHTKTLLGSVLTEPRPVSFLVDGVCTPARFMIQGYWMEWVRMQELLLVLLLRNDSEDCTIVFQLSKLSSNETMSYSMAAPSLLLFVAFIKFLPRIYLRRQRKAIASGGNGGLTGRRRVLSESERHELLQEKERIIRLMKQQDQRP